MLTSSHCLLKTLKIHESHSFIQSVIDDPRFAFIMILIVSLINDHDSFQLTKPRRLKLIPSQSHRPAVSMQFPTRAGPDLLAS